MATPAELKLGAPGASRHLGLFDRSRELRDRISDEVTGAETATEGRSLMNRPLASVLTGLLEPGADERVVGLLEHLGFRIFHPALLRTGDDGRPLILKGLDDFREHLGGELTITLLSDLGVGREVHEMNPDKILEAMHWLHDREGG